MRLATHRSLYEGLPLELCVHMSEELCRARRRWAISFVPFSRRRVAAAACPPGLNSASRVSTDVASSFSGKPFLTPCKEK